MSKTDWAIVALNVFTLFTAVIGLTAQHLDPMSMALALTLLTTLVNGGWVLLRSRSQQAKPVAHRDVDQTDEMDIHRVLDIDQRLEALEHAETRRLRELANEGLISAPADVVNNFDDALPSRQRV